MCARCLVGRVGRARVQVNKICSVLVGSKSKSQIVCYPPKSPTITFIVYSKTEVLLTMYLFFLFLLFIDPSEQTRTNIFNGKTNKTTSDDRMNNSNNNVWKRPEGRIVNRAVQRTGCNWMNEMEIVQAEQARPLGCRVRGTAARPDIHTFGCRMLVRGSPIGCFGFVCHLPLDFYLYVTFSALAEKRLREAGARSG